MLQEMRQPIDDERCHVEGTRKPTGIGGCAAASGSTRIGRGIKTRARAKIAGENSVERIAYCSDLPQMQKDVRQDLCLLPELRLPDAPLVGSHDLRIDESGVP